MPNHITLSSLDCFENGYDYPLSDLSGSPFSALDSVNCQDKCRNHASCAYFTFSPSSGACWLKTAAAFANRKPASDRISGPKTCPQGEMVLA